MKFPEVELKPGDTIFKADEKVERAFEKAGLALVAVEELNSSLGISTHCHFFHVPAPSWKREGGDGAGAASLRLPAVIVVMSRPWDEATLVQVLNILLGTRLDPYPPGSEPVFLFYSPYETPGVLLSVFGSTPCCQFESRALLVARFGHDFRAKRCEQMAALASFLSGSYLGIPMSFFDPGAEEKLEKIVRARFLVDKECVEPVNSLLALGCLSGEILRTRVPYRSSWGEIDDGSPWPGLVFAEEGKAEVTYNPIARTIQYFRSPESEFLSRTAEELTRRLEEAGHHRRDPVGDGARTGI